MSTLLLTASDFVRQYARVRVTLVMLVVIPILFVVAAAGAGGELSDALGGSASGDSMTALGGGWAAAFLGGVLGFFQVSSSRDADRRLALAGLGGLRVAFARIATCVVLALLATAVAFATVWVDSGLSQPARAFAAILACGLIYVGIGAIVGSLIRDELAGSLTVALIFLIDLYGGPGMSGSGGGAHGTPTRKAQEVLMDAGAGQAAPASDWIAAGLTVLGALAIAFLAFWLAARPRS
jgi:hypothetical protein